MARIDFPIWFAVGALAGIFNVLLVWIVSFFTPLSQFITGVNTVLGQRLVELLSGTAPFISTLPVLFVAAIGGGLLVWLGAWIYDQKWSPNFTGIFQKLAAILIYGSLGATIILSLPTFALPTVTVLVVLVINAVITAWFITKVLDETLGILKVPR